MYCRGHHGLVRGSGANGKQQRALRGAGGVTLATNSNGVRSTKCCTAIGSRPATSICPCRQWPRLAPCLLLRASCGPPSHVPHRFSRTSLALLQLFAPSETPAAASSDAVPRTVTPRGRMELCLEGRGVRRDVARGPFGDGGCQGRAQHLELQTHPVNPSWPPRWHIMVQRCCSVRRTKPCHSVSISHAQILRSCQQPLPLEPPRNGSPVPPSGHGKVAAAPSRELDAMP